jgi:phosphomannomutase
MPVSSRSTNSSKHNTDSETQEVPNDSNKLINIVTISASSNDSNYNELEFYEPQDSNVSIDADDDLETELDNSSNLQ